MAQDGILSVLDDVPDYQEFFTVDEMRARSHQRAAEYSDIVKVVSLGESRRLVQVQLGSALLALSHAQG